MTICSTIVQSYGNIEERDWGPVPKVIVTAVLHGDVIKIWVLGYLPKLRTTHTPAYFHFHQCPFGLLHSMASAVLADLHVFFLLQLTKHVWIGSSWVATDHTKFIFPGHIPQFPHENMREMASWSQQLLHEGSGQACLINCGSNKKVS